MPNVGKLTCLIKTAYYSISDRPVNNAIVLQSLQYAAPNNSILFRLLDSHVLIPYGTCMILEIEIHSWSMGHDAIGSKSGFLCIDGSASFKVFLSTEDKIRII